MTTIKRIAYVAAIPVTGAVALIGGTAIGLAANPEDMEPEVVTEEVEVIKEVEAEPEVITETVTEEVEVEVTPEACAEALGHAEEAFDIYSEGLMISADAVQQAGNLDIIGLEQSTEALEELTPILEDTLGSFYITSGGCQ